MKTIMQLKKKLPLILLITLPLLILLASVITFLIPNVFVNNTNNNGILLTPSQEWLWEDIKTIQPIIPRKWRLVILSKSCEINQNSLCQQAVEITKKTHDALGGVSFRAESYLIINNEYTSNLAEINSVVKPIRLGISNKNNLDELLNKYQTKTLILIIDPLNNLIMLYPPSIWGKAILRDLQKLIRFSKIG